MGDNNKGTGAGRPAVSDAKTKTGASGAAKQDAGRPKAVSGNTEKLNAISTFNISGSAGSDASGQADTGSHANTAGHTNNQANPNKPPQKRFTVPSDTLTGFEIDINQALAEAEAAGRQSAGNTANGNANHSANGVPGNPNTGGTGSLHNSPNTPNPQNTPGGANGSHNPSNTPAPAGSTHNNVTLTPVKKKNEGKKKLSRKTKKTIKTIIIVLIIILLLLAGIFYIRNRMQKGMAALREQMSASLTPAQVEKRNLTENISVTGKIKSNETRTQISMLASSAKILSVNVDVGDYVKEGDLLVIFSTEDIEKQIARTQEDLTRQKQLDNIAAADSQRNYVYTYQQAADTIQKNAENVDRALKALYEACDAYGDAKRNLQTAKDELEDYKEKLQEAQNNGDAAAQAEYTTKIKEYELQTIPGLESQVAAAKAKEEQAQQAYDDAVIAQADSRSSGTQYIQNNLSAADSTYQRDQINAGETARQKERTLEDQQDKLEDYVVTASMSGLVTKVNVSEGNSFQSGEVLTIQDMSKLTVDAEIDEYDIAKVKKGQHVLVKTEATGDEEFDGIVSQVNPTATAASATAVSSGSSSVTYTVTVDIIDKDERLMLGMTAKMSIIIKEQENVICVPYDAIGQNADGQPVVYVLDDMSLLDKNKPAPDSGSSGPFGWLGLDMSGGRDKPKDDSVIAIDSGAGGQAQGNSRPDAEAYHEVVVKTGMETDYYTEIITDKLKEGDYIVIKTEDGGNDLFNMMMGGMPPG